MINNKTPWSGGANPVEGKTVKIWMRDGDTQVEKSDKLRWTHNDWAGDILFYQVVNTVTKLEDADVADLITMLGEEFKKYHAAKARIKELTALIETKL